MRLEKQNGMYVCISEFNERFIPKQAGFDWNADSKKWETDSPYVASALAEYAEGELMDALFVIRNQSNSNIDENVSIIDVERFYTPGDTSLYPFQQNGIAWLLGRKFSMLSDSMGCLSGESIVGIRVVNEKNETSISAMPLKFLYTLFATYRERGSHLYALSLVRGNVAWNEIMDVKFSGHKEVVKLAVNRTGFSVTLTPDHEVCKSNAHWVETQKLTVDDWIMVIGDDRHLTMDRVTSITPAGRSDTYDLVMADPGRNFVANGIVVHNCGKTIQAIGVINHADPPIEKVLVVCPASLRINWRKELDHWLERPRAIYIVESQKGWSPFASIYIINYDILHKFRHELREFTWDLLIADEAHYLRNPKTKRTQHLLGKKWRYSRTGEWEIPPIPANRKIFITGTPIVNRPVELWPLVNALDPVNFGSYDKFTRRYCGAKRGRWGWDITGATHLDELRRILRSTIMLRRKKEDVLKDLPPKITSIIDLPHDGNGNVVKAEMQAFKEHESSLYELVISRELAKTFLSENDYKESVRRLRTGVAMAFTQLATERKRVAIAKVPLVIEYVDNIDEKVVIFAHHREVIHRLRSHFKQSCVWLNGECSLDDRQRAIEDFQLNPDIKVFIGSIQAAGVGITLTAARIAIFAELDWVPGNMEQASDRLHRIGQNDTVLIQYLVFDHSVDAKIAKTLVHKQDVIMESLDSDDDHFPLPFDELPSTLSLSFNEIAKQSENMTHETREIVRSALCNLSLVASDKINRFDKIIVDNLLVARYLSSKEAALGRAVLMLNKDYVDSETIRQIQD